MVKAPNTQELLEKWEPMMVAEGVEPIKNYGVKKTLARIFESTTDEFIRKGLITEAEVAPHGSMTHKAGLGKSPVGKKDSSGYLKGPYGREDGPITKNDGNVYLPNVIMPLLRRIYPSLVAHELVGVQAMNGPVGYALAYRAKYGTNGGVGIGNEGDMGYGREGGSTALTAQPAEMAFNPVDTRYTGTADTALTAQLTGYGDASATDQLTAFESYAGKQGMEAWNGTAVDTEKAEFASFLNGTYPTVSFDFCTSMVQAKTRKLGAGYSPELKEDMEAMHNFDVESEFVNMVSYEIGAAIDRQIVTEIMKAAIIGGSISTWSPAFADGLDQMGRLATLLTQITVEANQIAVRTRRGHANFVVTSPRVIALLQQLSLNKFVSISNTNADAPSVPDSGVGALTKVGKINDNQQLLVRDTYAVKDYVAMGYKGAHPADNGIIYCPYIPVELKKVQDPYDLTERIGARTRYGIMNSVWDAKNYYHFIRVADITKPYAFNAQRQFVQPFSAVKNGTLWV